MDKQFLIHIAIISPIFYLFVRLFQSNYKGEGLTQWLIKILGNKFGKEIAIFIYSLWGTIVIIWLIWQINFQGSDS